MSTSQATARGVGNRKEVRQKVRAHVLEYFEQDRYASDTPGATPESNLREQMQVMQYGTKTLHDAAIDLVMGGTFLIYDGEIADFINGLGFNPENKQYTGMEILNKYSHLLAREIVDICK